MRKLKKKAITISNVKCKKTKFEAAEFASTSSAAKYRERQNILVFDEPQFLCHSHQIPECAHGPCLLFSDSTGNRWFACSVFRSRKLCRFRVTLNADGTLMPYNKKFKVHTAKIEEYGSMHKSYETLVREHIQPYWCTQCNNFVQIPHAHTNIKGPIIIRQSPIELLDSIQEDSGEAQYWFSKETIGIVDQVLTNEEVDSYMCIGTPTLFEEFRQKGRNVFLLDFDDRLSLFYGANEFARFSMLVCHFYIPESRQYLLEFFRRSRKLVCLCDPPFGVHVSALIRTIEKLKRWFEEEKGIKPDSKDAEFKPSSFNSILFLPYFVGKHLKASPLSMVDYKVTYSNHREFSKSQKSIVRMFTDLPNKAFKLPLRLGYHFCDECDRFVSQENRHCWKCGECTSKDGSPFVHCDRCGRCVRKKYKHCRKCANCHLTGRCNRT